MRMTTEDLDAINAVPEEITISVLLYPGGEWSICLHRDGLCGASHGWRDTAREAIAAAEHDLHEQMRAKEAA